MRFQFYCMLPHQHNYLSVLHISVMYEECLNVDLEIHHAYRSVIHLQIQHKP